MWCFNSDNSNIKLLRVKLHFDFMLIHRLESSSLSQHSIYQQRYCRSSYINGQHLWPESVNRGRRTMQHWNALTLFSKDCSISCAFFAVLPFNSSSRRSLSILEKNIIGSLFNINQERCWVLQIMSHLLGCLNSQHPLSDASELWWWDIIERGGKKRKSSISSVAQQLKACKTGNWI